MNVGGQGISGMFAAIRIAHVRGYLLAKGWEITSAAGTDVLHFEGPPEHQDDPYKLLLPAWEQSPAFKGRLQHLVFTLSVIESREAGEVARDILDAKTQEAQAVSAIAGQPETPACQVVAIRVRNSRSQPLPIRLQSWEGTYVLLPGEAVDVVVPPDDGLPELDYADQAAVIYASKDARLFLVHSGKNDGVTATPWEIICRVCEQHGVVFLNGWEPSGSGRKVLAAMELLHDEGPANDDVGPAWICKLVGKIAKMISIRAANDKSITKILWVICVEMLQPLGVRIEVYPDAAEHLAASAVSPDRAAAWLMERISSA